jgi:hypothetical protein
MSYIFRLVFIYFCVLLVVYNGIVLFPAVSKDPTVLTVFKITAAVLTIIFARAIFKPRPKSVVSDDGYGGP